MKDKIKRIIDYSRYPEEKIVRTVMASYDGKQFFIRIPKPVSDFLAIKKGDKLRFMLDIKYVSESGKKIVVVEKLD